MFHVKQLDEWGKIKLSEINISYMTKPKPKELVKLNGADIFINPSYSEPFIVMKSGNNYNLVSIKSGLLLFDPDTANRSLERLSKDLRDYLDSDNYESSIFASENVEINLVLTEEKSYDI